MEIYEKILTHQADGGRVVLERNGEAPRELVV